MYEKFTDRARKVMKCANEEAIRFNHEYIGTEHILLGLVKEGTGTGAQVLKQLDIDLRRIRLEVEKLVQSGPEKVVMDKLPQTPRAKRAIEYCMEEAQNLNHDHVGTEHILLGLLHDEESVAYAVLSNLGLEVEAVREEVLIAQVVGRSDAGQQGQEQASTSSESTEQREKSATPALDSFGVSWTQRAAQQCWGLQGYHDDVMSDIIVGLTRRRRNAVALLLDSGVVEEIVLRGLAEVLTTAPRRLHIHGASLVEMNMPLLLAGAKFRGQFEERWLACCREAMRQNVVMVLRQASINDWKDSGLLRAEFDALFDSIHQGTRLLVICQQDRWAKLQSSLERSTLDNLSAVRFPQEAFDFETVHVGLRAEAEIFAAHHRVVINDEAIERAFAIARDASPSPGRALLARDLVDQTCARASFDWDRQQGVEEQDLLVRIEEADKRKEEFVTRQEFEQASAEFDERNRLAKELESMRQSSEMSLPQITAAMIDETYSQRYPSEENEAPREDRLRKR